MTELVSFNETAVRDGSTDCPDMRNESGNSLRLSGIVVRLDSILGVGLTEEGDPHSLDALLAATREGGSTDDSALF